MRILAAALVGIVLSMWAVLIYERPAGCILSFESRFGDLGIYFQPDELLLGYGLPDPKRASGPTFSTGIHHTDADELDVIFRTATASWGKGRFGWLWLRPAPQRTEGWFVVFPAWFATALGVLPMTVLSAARFRAWRRRSTGLCDRCGYDLRATPGRCPECGKALQTPTGRRPSSG